METSTSIIVVNPNTMNIVPPPQHNNLTPVVKISVGDDHRVVPFWNQNTPLIAKHLWFPRKSDITALPLSQFHPQLQAQAKNCWYSTTVVSNLKPQDTLHSFLLDSITECEKPFIHLQKELYDQESKKIGIEIKKKETVLKKALEKKERQIVMNVYGKQTLKKPNKINSKDESEDEESEEEVDEKTIKKKSKKKDDYYLPSVKSQPKKMKKISLSDRLKEYTKQSKNLAAQHAQALRANRYRATHPAGKTLKIRLFLKSYQKNLFRRWFGTARWTYNRCLDEVKRKGPSALNVKYLRSKFVSKSALKGTDFEWALETPREIRDQAMKDLIKAYDSSTALHAGTKKKFELKFKSKKAPSDSIAILHRAWTAPGKFFSTFWKRLKTKNDIDQGPIITIPFLEQPYKKENSKKHSTEFLPDNLVFDTRLQLSRGKFYLCKLLPLTIRSETQAPINGPRGEGRIIALDPGNTTFQTGYDAGGLAYEWGKRDISSIMLLARKYDKLQSRWSKKEYEVSGIKYRMFHAERRKLKKRGHNIQDKMKGRIKAIHCNIIKFLVENYHTILIPAFETQKMASRKTRKFNGKVAQALLTWSHYAFRTRLIAKAREYPWVKVIIVNEAYTSQTCGKCGNIYSELKHNKEKIFKCPKKMCGEILDRDVNGARNIMIRWLETTLAYIKNSNSNNDVIERSCSVESGLLDLASEPAIMVRKVIFAKKCRFKTRGVKATLDSNPLRVLLLLS